MPFFFSIIRPPPISTLFPYTTLFRSDFGSARMSRAVVRLPFASPPPLLVSVSSPEAGLPWLVLPERADSSDRKSTRLNSSHPSISYAVFCLKKKNHQRSCIHRSLDND